jgi:hypothetical protein
LAAKVRRRRRNAVVEFVLIALLVLAAANKGREVITAWLFAIGFVSYMVNSVIFGFQGYSYYLASAASCLTAVIFLTHHQPRDEIHIDLSIFFIIGIIFNGLGWIAYELYMEPLSYNVAFGVLYIGLIIRLLVRKNTDGVGRAVTYSNRVSAFLSFCMHCCKNDKEGKA